jgi:NADH dehydrogenase (ubiquinone) 1 alpha subcomplex subunit 13
MTQDLPPQGGFPETVKYQRYLPQRGPSGAVIFLAVAGIMGYGWYKFSGALREKKYVFILKLGN